MKNNFFIYSLILFLSTIVIFFSIIALFNYYIDPYSVFKLSNFSLEKKIVSNLSNKKKSVIKSYWNDDLVRYLQISNGNIEKECVVIGSSTSLKLSSDILNCKTTNLGLGGSGVEDKIALVNLMLKKERMPEITLIVVDPWIFSKNYNYPLQPEWISSYVDALNKLDFNLFSTFSKLKYTAYKYLSFINLRTTKTSVKYFYYTSINKNNYFEEGNSQIYYTYNPDGTLDHSKDESKTSEEINNYLIKLYNENSKEYLNNERERQYKFSLYKYILFKDYINFISKKNKIALLILPYHPYAYEKIIEKNKNYFEMENILKSEDFNDNVKVLGSFNPAFTCLDSEFYDDYHPKRSCLKKIFNKNILR